MKKLSKRVLFSLLMTLGLLTSSVIAISDAHFVAPVYADPADDGDGAADSDSAETDDADDTDDTADSDTDDSEDTDEAGSDTDSDDSDDSNNTDNSEEGTETPTEDQEPICQQKSGSVSWIICPIFSFISNGVDDLYGIIENFLEVEPLTTDSDSTIHRVWAYMRDLTNIVFIIFLLIVIYSQITGFGIDNYGVKRILPRLIIAVIMVNLSYIICSLCVDLSNVIGSSLGDFFNGIMESTAKNVSLEEVSWSDFANYIVGGIGIAAIGVVGAGGIGAVLWMAVIALLGVAISIIIGFITISLRQGLVTILIMIAPLAFVAYLLPNTEKWFEKWKNLFFQMLFFYPMFAFLFSASKLSGWAIIAAANGDMFEILLGLTLQVLPLFLSVSLMKMSGTVLGRVNTGFERLTNPARRTLDHWGNSHIDKARAHYLRNNRYWTGARLRNYLAERERRRLVDTTNAQNTVSSRINTNVNRRLAGYVGRDEFGNDIYRRRANGNTQRAKEASLNKTLEATSEKMLTNTLSEYGDIFQGKKANNLAGQHAEAFVDSMMETFRAENIAQGDQNYLLNRYIQASKDRARNPAEFNRLLRNANGGLGRDGENTIMGQVLSRSVEIEGRNRRNAIVVANKFDFRKPEFRAFALDAARMGDDGLERDADGNRIQDEYYNYTGEHKEWGKYYYTHKDTRKEISKDEYRMLSPDEQANYKRTRYMDIYDDSGDVVASFTENDAGFMKEMLARDIAIGDPINERYNMSLGKENGPLRRYHSTITAAMLTADYKKHAAEAGQMLEQWINYGFIDSPGKYNLAAVICGGLATKPKDFLINDAPAYKRYARYLRALNDPEEFAKTFPDEDIRDLPDINGKLLDGLRYDTEKQAWVDVPRKDATIEDLRNTVKHKYLPRFAFQLIDFMKNEPSQSVKDNRKAGGHAALLELTELVGQMALDNADPNKPIDQRLDPNTKFFGKDGAVESDQIIKAFARKVKQLAEQEAAEESATADTANEALNDMQRELERQANDNLAQLWSTISDIINDQYSTNPQAMAAQVRGIFQESPSLRRYSIDLEEIITECLRSDHDSSVEDSIESLGNPEAANLEKIENLRSAIESLYNRILGEQR